MTSRWLMPALTTLYTGLYRVPLRVTRRRAAARFTVAPTPHYLSWNVMGSWTFTLVGTITSAVAGLTPTFAAATRIAGRITASINCHGSHVRHVRREHHAWHAWHAWHSLHHWQSLKHCKACIQVAAAP